MSPASVVEVVTLLKALAPSVQGAVGAIVKAFHSKDEKAVREALEAGLRLQFEARQVAAPKGGRK